MDDAALKVLELLAQGKLTAEQADMLLEALETVPEKSTEETAPAAKQAPASLARSMPSTAA